MNDEEYQREMDAAIDRVARLLPWFAVAVVAYVAVMIGAAVWVQA